ncbi:hypothetical protein [Streptomyces sp. NPDC098781]|uniref:hypothetical protein n=1 Tax=Streptomyces sp. NPDC098781 TaxID=3366097 RepID=UPI00380A6DEA
MDTESLVEVWRRILAPSGTSWVLFEHGTCVVLKEPAGDLAGQASGILGEFGPVRVGSSAGDFNVLTLKDDLGWLVTGHHPDVVTYVAPDEPVDPSHLTIGIHGRGKRHQDGTQLQIAHVEDRRPAADR